MPHQWLGISASCMLRWQLIVQERRYELILASQEVKLIYIYLGEFDIILQGRRNYLADSTMYCFRIKKISHLTS